MSKLCTQLALGLGCYDDGTERRTVQIHHEYGVNDAGKTIIVATRYTEADGTPIDTTGGTVTPGACALLPSDVEILDMCDVQADGTIIEFKRRTITTFDSTGAPTTTVSDWLLDFSAEYTPTGTVGVCNEDCDPSTAEGVLTTWG